LPFKTVKVTCLGGIARFRAGSLWPSATAVAVEATPTSGLRNCCTASVMLLCEVESSFWPTTFWIFTWKTWPCGRL
jgi:hypothetical protein